MDEPIKPTAEKDAPVLAKKPGRRAAKRPLMITGTICMPDSVLPWERELIAPALSSTAEKDANGKG